MSDGLSYVRRRNALGMRLRPTCGRARSSLRTGLPVEGPGRAGSGGWWKGAAVGEWRAVGQGRVLCCDMSPERVVAEHLP